MSKDVATNRLLRVDSVCHATAWISHHLVRHEDSDVELLTDLLHLGKHAAENLLSLCQFSTTRVVYSIRGYDRINDHESKLVLYHSRCSLQYQVVQAVDSKGSSNHYVVQDLLRIKIEALCNLLDTLRTAFLN